MKSGRPWSTNLEQWGVVGQRAVLRGALASVFLNPRRRAGADADGVWLMGALQPDGTRAPGIANQTIEALQEIEIMGTPLTSVMAELVALWHDDAGDDR